MTWHQVVLIRRGRENKNISDVGRVKVLPRFDVVIESEQCAA
jgi:hypothetical protein